MQVTILDAVPTDLSLVLNPELKTDPPSYVQMHGLDGLDARVVGAGSIDVYFWWDGAWSLHPEGAEITTWERLVVSDAQVYACAVGTGTDEESVASLAPCRRS